MKKYFFFLITLCFACTGKKPDNITLFNGVTFETKQGEEIPAIDQNISNEYKKYLGAMSDHIPLFRYVHHKDYGVFIGLPFSISKDSLMQIKPSLPLLNPTIETTDSATMVYRKFTTREGLQLHTLFYEINNSKIFIIGRTYQSGLPDSLLSEKALKSRIKITTNPNVKKP